jgi:hypothetical protein
VGILLVGNAVAGEYVKAREVMYNTKWEQINVGDEKDHVVGVWAAKGIYSNMQGKTFGEGWLGLSVGLLDINPKTGVTSNGYVTLTDKEGNKAYFKCHRTQQKGLADSGEWSFFKGTGKLEGIQGKGTYLVTHVADPMQWYVDLEGEVELP